MLWPCLYRNISKITGKIKPLIKTRIFILGFSCLLALFIYALWPTERGSLVSYKRDNYTRTGERIIALPGESIRISPDTGAIYLKIKGKTYRLRENRLPNHTRTYAFESKFTTGWHALGHDEYLILSDRRVHQRNEYWDNFVRTENVINRSQIIKKISTGRRIDFEYESIDPAKEFRISTDADVVSWHTTVGGSTRINNGAKPVISSDYIFVPTSERDLLRIDKGTGQVIWEQTFASTIKTIEAEYDQNLLFVTIGDVYPTSAQTLVALDKNTGKIIWQANDTTLGIAMDPGALSILLTIHDGTLLGQDKKTGAVLWKSSSVDFYETSTSPHEAAILIKDSKNQLSLIRPDSGTAVWTSEIKISKRFNVIGRYQDKIIVSDDTRILAINSESGRLHWSFAANYANDSQQKVKLIDDMLITVDPQGRARGLGASDIPTAYERRVAMTSRSIISGNIIWDQVLPNAGLNATIVDDTDKQILVRTGDGGNSYEDWSIVQRLYSIDKKTGHIIFDRELPDYAKLYTIGDSVLIAQRDLLCVDVATGAILWQIKNYATSGDKDTHDIEVVIDEINKLLFMRNHDMVEQLSTSSGKQIWSQKVESGYGDFYLDGDYLLLNISGTSTLYGLDPKTGGILWKISDVYAYSDEYRRPYLNSRGELFFWRFANLEMKRRKLSFYRFDQETSSEQSIFSHVVLDISDIQIMHDQADLFIFTDDAVSSLDLE